MQHKNGEKYVFGYTEEDKNQPTVKAHRPAI